MQSIARPACRQLARQLRHSQKQLGAVAAIPQTTVSRYPRRQQYATVQKSRYDDGSARSAVINVLNNIASKREVNSTSPSSLQWSLSNSP
jgi:N-acetyl-gamma-glutamyl-phosphate reductase/acetylglutamate kinase